MATFWLATAFFVILGLTPVVVATTLNRRDRTARRGGGE